jgi:Mycothiol maleylpyruvate isomerase N-terminal domain
VNGGDVLEAAGECRTLLGAAVDRDWTQPIPEMDWTVAQAVIHIAEGTLWYATDLAAGEERQDTMELRVPPETANAELTRVVGTFATVLARAIVERLFPWAPVGGDPWPALLWANGRIELPGHPRQARWRWHCAPLEEWDGVNPADRRRPAGG